MVEGGSTSDAGAGAASPLTWAALLAKWMRLAQQAIALPDEGDAGRVKATLPMLIELQASTLALHDADMLGRDGYAAGVDLAEVCVRRSAGAVHSAWRGEPVPREIIELVEDAVRAVAIAREAGVEVRAASDGRTPVPVRAEDLRAAGFEGQVLSITGGVWVKAGTPVCFALDRGGRPLASEALAVLARSYAGMPAERRSPMRQVYRDSSASETVDRVRLFDDTLVAGVPLLAAIDGPALPRVPDVAGAHRVDVGVDRSGESFG
jgi:hypothetical protein